MVVVGWIYRTAGENPVEQKIRADRGKLCGAKIAVESQVDVSASVEERVDDVRAQIFGTQLVVAAADVLQVDPEVAGETRRSSLRQPIAHAEAEPRKIRAHIESRRRDVVVDLRARRVVGGV